MRAGRRARSASSVRQPWYPVEERYGLVFAYLGPPERKPVLPRYDVLERLDDGEFVEADDFSIGGGGPAIIPCNWLQHYENVVDPFHVPILHGSFSGAQFVDADGPDAEGDVREIGRRGVKATLDCAGWTTARRFRRVTEAVLPTLRVVPNPRVGAVRHASKSIGWVLPIDDTHFRIYVAGRVQAEGRARPHALALQRQDLGRAHARRSTSDFPGDYEAQVGQGPITLHSEEHLVTSDQGVVMLRRCCSASSRRWPPARIRSAWRSPSRTPM